MVNSSTDNSATDGADPPLNYSLYSEGEKVLAYHRNRIYEAKVQKIEPRENEQRYFLHYLGWNKVWDEWVGVDRLLKYNEENIMKQKTLDMTQSVDNNTASGQLTQMNPESPPVEKGRKRKNDSSAEVWNTLGLNDTVSLERLVNSQILSTLRKPVGDELKFICQQEKDLLGMDAGSSCQINETNKKGCRRHWTKKEEDALLRILEDLVAKGHRVNRVFRPGTLNVVENALCNLCPGSDLKASPHIESKLKKLKKQFRIVYDMVNSPGFGWNNAEKCVKVNSEKAWKAYLQHHKEAYGWRGKYFPHYDGLVKIFKVDNANGKASGNPGEIVEEINCDEVNATVFGIEEDTCPRSVDQISTTKQTDQSHSSQRKRRRQDDTRDSPIIERAKKGYRYRWTKEEEGALLGILEDLVAKGHCDNGTFRSSAMTLIENALSNLCPESGLKATPHVESKLKKWKKEYRIVNDMLNRNGFRWNGLKKSVEVDSEEAWKAYVQHHKEADGWRDKYFPIYDLFVNIFDVKRVPAKPSQTPVERVGAINRDEEIRGDEDINCDEDVGSEEESADFGTNEGASSRSIDQISTNNQTDQSHSSPQRSGRQEDGFGVPVDEVPAPVMDVVKTSNEQMRVLHESRQSPKGNKIDELYREVKVLGLPVTDRVKVLRLLVTKPLNAELFLTLDREEKLEFVKLLVEEASKK